MGAARRALAFPIYAMAFVLHLLTAMATIIAQQVAGDTSPPSCTVKRAIVAALALVLAAMPAWFASRAAPDVDPGRLAPRPAMDFSRVVVNYSEAELPEIKSLIRLSACLYAERALKQWMFPERAQFTACGDGGRNKVVVDETLIDVSVSGITFAGTTARPFIVTLEHNPISTDEEGFITRHIHIEDGETRSRVLSIGLPTSPSAQLHHSVQIGGVVPPLVAGH